MRFRYRKTGELELQAQPEFREAMQARTEVLAATIRAAAPRGKAIRPGYSTRVHARRGQRVVLTDIAWHLVEYGSANNPPYAPVRRSVIALGMRFDDSGPGGIEHMPGIS